MISAIEEAVATVILAGLMEDETVSEIDYEVLTMTRRTEAAQDRTSVVVEIAQGDFPNSKLLNVIAQIMVATPANFEGTSLENHRAMEMAVNAIFDRDATIDGETVKDLLSDEIEARTNEAYTGGGYYREELTTANDDTTWMGTIQVKIAIRQD